VTVIPIKRTRPYTWILMIVGATADFSDIRVDDRRVRVRMGIGFRAKFERANVRSVEPYRSCLSVGVHGWNGRWLVNGAHRPIASVQLVTPARAWVLGFPVRFEQLLVSVTDIAQLRDALLT
jgi:hypothetical protein